MFAVETNPSDSFNVQLTFEARLSPKEREDIQTSFWLERHIRRLSRHYISAQLHVTSITYYPDGNPGPMTVTATYVAPDGSQGRQGYSIGGDSLNILPVFKITGMDVGGRKHRKPVEPTYGVLTIDEARMSWEKPRTTGLVLAGRNPRETPGHATRREVAEETGWHMPRMAKVFQLRRFHNRGGATENLNIMGVYAELRADRPKDRDLLVGLRNHEGGFKEEGEDIRSKVRTFKQFFATPHLRERFGPDLGLFAKRFAAQGDYGPLSAYEAAEEPYLKGFRSRRVREAEAFQLAPAPV